MKATLSANSEPYPEFIELPKPGRQEFYSGLRRSTLNRLILPCPSNDFRPPVKSVSLRRPGAQKGKRLIHLQGLLSFLHREMEKGGHRFEASKP